jgi:hypothetical protein
MARHRGASAPLLTMDNVLRWLRHIFIGAEKPPDIEEAHYPRDAKGKPDLTRFTRPADHYARYIDDYLKSLESPRTVARGKPPLARERQVYEYQKYVLGQWGLIARGPANALPTVLRLLQHKLPEGRQAASGVLSAWTEGGTQLEAPVLAAVERELADANTDIETLSSLIGILGRVRAEAALPLLARVLRDPNSKNGDVDWCAIEAIGDIAQQKFVKDPEPKQAAERWLQQRGL